MKATKDGKIARDAKREWYIAKNDLNRAVKARAKRDRTDRVPLRESLKVSTRMMGTFAPEQADWPRRVSEV